jgi:hypothetical protein
MNDGMCIELRTRVARFIGIFRVVKILMLVMIDREVRETCKTIKKSIIGCPCVLKHFGVLNASLDANARITQSMEWILKL